MAIGSGMSGGICDIRIHDCVVRGTERGIRIKSMRGRGGYVKRINVERMQMDEIEKEAIEVSMNYGSSTAVPVSQKAPEFSEIRFATLCAASSSDSFESEGIHRSKIIFTCFPPYVMRKS